MKNSKLLKDAIKAGLKVVHLDIETSPYLVWTYPLWDANIPTENIEVPMQVTSIGWMFEDGKVKVKGWKDSYVDYWIQNKKRDYDLLKEVIPEINEADIIIGQNLNSYDIKKIQWRLCELKLPPLKNIITIDTLRQSRKAFSPPSHKLDYKSKVHGKGGKIKQTMEDCIAVAKGDKKKQTIRMKYNAKDVTDERHMFWKELDYYILPKALLNMLYNYVKKEKPFCIKCAARHQKRFDVKSIRHKRENKYQCNQCEYIWRIK